MNTLPLVRDLMPMKDFVKATQFVNELGSILDFPYERNNCGCIYVKVPTETGGVVWLTIGACPICRLKEDIESHRDHRIWL